MPQTVIIHERLNAWARQLRPRLSGSPIAWVESRSGDDLASALRGSVVPIVVIDLGDQAGRRLEDVALARGASPDGLILVLDPGDRAEVAALARELGASHVLSGVATPPDVARLLARWIALAGHRARDHGWIAPSGPADPWDPDAIPDLAPRPARPTLSR